MRVDAATTFLAVMSQDVVYNRWYMSRSHKPTGTGCRRVPVDDPEFKADPRILGLQINDDAMVGRHIVAEDVLIFEHGREPRSGEIVAAFVDGESVARSYVLQDGGEKVLSTGARARPTRSFNLAFKSE